MSQSAPAWSGKQHVGQLYLTLAQFAVELAGAHWVVPGLQPKITWGVHGRNQTQEERNLNSENVQFYFSVLVKIVSFIYCLDSTLTELLVLLLALICKETPQWVAHR